MNARPCCNRLTDRVVNYCKFATGARIADVGCGDGDTASYVEQRYGLDVIGVDISPTLGANVVADAAAMPFEDESFDGVFFKCSFSVIADPESALREARRVLRFGGWLAIDDFYARECERDLTGVVPGLGRIERVASIIWRLGDAGFELSLFEDHTDDVRSKWAQTVFDGDACAADARELAAARCGYALFVARAAGEHGVSHSSQSPDAWG